MAGLPPDLAGSLQLRGPFYFYTPFTDELLTSEERPPVPSHTSQGAEASSSPHPQSEAPPHLSAQISVSLSPQSLTVNSSCVCDICLSPFQGHSQYSEGEVREEALRVLTSVSGQP